MRWTKNWPSSSAGRKKPSTRLSVRDPTCSFRLKLTDTYHHPGQRLAAQKGESDDIVGAMKAQERQTAADSLSDEDDD